MKLSAELMAALKPQVIKEDVFANVVARVQKRFEVAFVASQGESFDYNGNKGFNVDAMFTNGETTRAGCLRITTVRKGEANATNKALAKFLKDNKGKVVIATVSLGTKDENKGIMFPWDIKLADANDATADDE